MVPIWVIGTLAYASIGAGSGCGSGASVVVVRLTVVVAVDDVVLEGGAATRASALSSRVTTNAVAPMPTASTLPITKPTSVRFRCVGLMISALGVPPGRSGPAHYV